MSQLDLLAAMRRQHQIDDLPWMKKRKAIEGKKQKRAFKWLNLSWQSEAVKVIKAKLAHYEATGNENKAVIYRLKLKHSGSLIDKLKLSVKKPEVS